MNKTGFKLLTYSLTASVLGVAGCAGLPQEESVGEIPRPPEQWSATGLFSSENTQNWLDDFDAPELKLLASEALRFNHNLKSAAARLSAARARAGIADAALLPSIDAGLSGSRSRRNLSGNASTSNTFELGLDITWEADLWGRLSNSARAAALESEAAESDYRSARLSLASDVAKHWFRTIETELQLRLAVRTEESFRRTLGVIEERYRRGLNTALDVRLSRSEVAAAQSALAGRQRDKDAAVRSLEILLGRFPSAALSAADELPGLAREIPAGLPAELLSRRPDLVAAQARLEAAGERLDEARKNRLPAIRLTAGGGTASDELGDLLDWDNLVWSLFAGVTQPLFKGGKLRAEEMLARAQRREVWENYAQVALTAFKEVETSLAAEAYYDRQEQALRIASDEARAAEGLALDRYRQGLVNIITLLEAQRRAFNADSNLLRVSRERLENRVALYLALGGDFRADTEDVEK